MPQSSFLRLENASVLGFVLGLRSQETNHPPIANIGISGGCEEKAWFGWPCDKTIEQLRDDFSREADPAKQKHIAEKLQAVAYSVVPYVNYGQWFQPVAYRSNLKGVLISPVPFFWNIKK